MKTWRDVRFSFPSKMTRTCTSASTTLFQQGFDQGQPDCIRVILQKFLDKEFLALSSWHEQPVDERDLALVSRPSARCITRQGPRTRESRALRQAQARLF
eukprot:scaffold3242_cov137-Ochromonas_danica.AAC.1